MEYQKENRYYVYALVDPINKVPFYIGKGSGKRAYTHLKNEKTNSNKVRMINNIRMLNFEPTVHLIIENLNEKDAYEMEYLMIKNAKYCGIKLVNKSGINMPPNRKGCKISDETKRKISLALKGIKRKSMSQETKDKLSSINKGKNGPNKVFLSNIEELKNLYINVNYTKKQLCDFYHIGLGSLNRILSENKISKLK